MFLAIGAAATIKDYHNAQENEKLKVLVKNSSMLAGSVLAFSLINPLTKAFVNTEMVKNTVKLTKKLVFKIAKKEITSHKVIKNTQKAIEQTEKVVKTSIAATVNTFAGVAGAVAGSELVSRFVLNKPFFDALNKRKIKDDTENDNSLQNNNGFFKNTAVFNNFDYTTPKILKEASDRVFATFTDMPDVRLLSAPMVALTGFSVAKTDGYDNKLKKTSYELLANTFVPTIFVTAASIFLEHKKPVLKYLGMFAALFVGAVAGKYAADKITPVINQKIDKFK